MTIKFYGSDTSVFSRAVWMALDVLQLDYELIVTKASVGDTRKPDFLKINPQHTIPVIIDDGFVVTESRAILLYLARTYARDGHASLYPTDITERTMVDQRLFFDHWDRLRKLIHVPVLYKNVAYNKPTARQDLQEVLDWCQAFLEPSGFIAGTRHISIADLYFLAHFSTFRNTPVDGIVFHKALNEWEERCAQLVPNYDSTNLVGAVAFGERFRHKLHAL